MTGNVLEKQKFGRGGEFEILKLVLQHVKLLWSVNCFSVWGSGLVHVCACRIKKFKKKKM